MTAKIRFIFSNWFVKINTANTYTLWRLSRVSLLRIENRYILDGSVFDALYGKRLFSALHGPGSALGLTQSLNNGYMSLSPEGKSVWAWHWPHTPIKSWCSAQIEVHLCSSLWAMVACYDRPLTLLFQNIHPPNAPTRSICPHWIIRLQCEGFHEI